MTRCNAAICATLLRAFDKAGAPTITPIVGKRLIRNRVPDVADTYGGRVNMPLMTISSNTLVARSSIKSGLCNAPTW